MLKGTAEILEKINQTHHVILHTMNMKFHKWKRPKNDYIHRNAHFMPTSYVVRGNSIDDPMMRNDYTVEAL